MLIPDVKISFWQQPTQKEPTRLKSFVFDCSHEWECSDSWADLTNKCTISLPKKIYIRDGLGKLVSLGDTNKGIGGDSGALFLRGDKVRIESGYRYRNSKGNFVKETNVVFEGYVTKVGAKMPLQLECEDNMYLLKQKPAKAKVYSDGTTVESMLKEMLAGTGFTVNVLTATTIGAFRTENETVAQVLARLRKEYRLESYFRGQELRCGSLVYVEGEAKTEVFAFQQDIISDELEYQRKDDITLSAVAHNTIEEETGKQTKDGHAKTKKKRLEVLVTLRNDVTTTIVKEKGRELPENVEGERRTFFFIGDTTVQQLAADAARELQKYYYTGLKGSFETFGLPFVRMGDNVEIKDSVLPDRGGTYKVKAVTYKGGVNGLRQKIQLDYKIK